MRSTRADHRYTLNCDAPVREDAAVEMEAVKAYWDKQAADFDGEPDHGLLGEQVWRAWRDLLIPLVSARSHSAPGMDVVDLGCGTGSLSVLLAQHGHRVVGVDLSDEMVTAATQKALAAGVTAEFEQGDVSHPNLLPASLMSCCRGTFCGRCPTPPRLWLDGSGCCAQAAC